MEDTDLVDLYLTDAAHRVAKFRQKTKKSLIMSWAP